jgi:Protein of unknown function (DUF433)
MDTDVSRAVMIDLGGMLDLEEMNMNDEKWIVSDRDHLGGKPRVRGTRISVAFLLECLALT